MKHKLKAKILAITLRRSGSSLNEISEQIGISKSTASLWVRNLKLSKKAHGILTMKNPTFNKNLQHPCSEKTKIVLRRLMKKRWRVGVFDNIPSPNSNNNKLELHAKTFIEDRLKTKFIKPKKINGVWFDFVNRDYIVEYSISLTGGPTNAINRFRKLKNDKRQRIYIGFSKFFGMSRRKKLEDTGAWFIPIWFETR